MLLKLHYAKFDVCRLFRSKVIEEKPWGSARPPLIKEGLSNYPWTRLSVTIKGTITQCDLSPRFFCIDAMLLCEFESDKI